MLYSFIHFKLRIHLLNFHSISVKKFASDRGTPLLQVHHTNAGQILQIYKLNIFYQVVS